MNFALFVLSLFAATTCLAQQSVLEAAKQQFVVRESNTISVNELQQRTQSKARETFIDAKVAAREGNHQRAIKLFEKVVKKDPLFSDARNDLAVELIISGQQDRAVTELQQAVQLDPHFLMGYTNLGVVLYNQQKFPDAELVVRRALSLDPNSGKASLLLALALHAQGNVGAETREALEVAARSNSIATKLLKKWFGISDVASGRIEPN